MTIRVNPDWWKTLFDHVYLLTDARSVCEDWLTRLEVDMICELIPIHPDHRILDLCGGHGRHSLDLCRRGYRRCTVLDYSSYLINHGKASADAINVFINFVNSDARNTGLESSTFEHVLIMGNSLGYMLDEDADRLILNEAGRILRSGGWLLIDVANSISVKADFSPIAWHEIGHDIVVCRQREMDRDVIRSREIVISKEKGLIRDTAYSMRLYDPESVVSMLGEIGFISTKIHTEFAPHQKKGDYGFMNNRMIAIAQKP